MDGNDRTQSQINHLGVVHNLRLTPDGEKVISTSDDCTIKVWSVGTGQLEYTLKGHTDVIYRAVITPDGTKIVSASFDHTLKVWDANQGVELMTLTGHEGSVNDVAIIPNTDWIISASNDETLKVWHLKTGEEIMTLTGHTCSVTAVAITPDGRQIISAAKDSNDRKKEEMKVWDLATGQEKYPLKGAGFCNIIWYGRYSHQSENFLLSRDGLHLIIARADHVSVWDLAEEKVVCTTPTIKKKYYLPLAVGALTHDERQILAGTKKGTLLKWDKTSGQVIYSIDAHSGSITGLTLTPGGNRIATVSKDKTLKIWDIETGEHLTTYYFDGALSTCVMAPDGTLIVGETLGRIHFLQLIEGNQ